MQKRGSPHGYAGGRTDVKGLATVDRCMIWTTLDLLIGLT